MSYEILTDLDVLGNLNVGACSNLNVISGNICAWKGDFSECLNVGECVKISGCGNIVVGSIDASGGIYSSCTGTGVCVKGVIKISCTSSTSICTSGGIKATGALSSGSVSTGNITSTGVIKTSSTSTTSICTSGGITATGQLVSGCISTGDILSNGNITANTGRISGREFTVYCGSNLYSYLGYQGLKICCIDADSIRTCGGIYASCGIKTSCVSYNSIETSGGIYSGCTGLSFCTEGTIKTYCESYNSIDTNGGISSNCTNVSLCAQGQLKTFCNAYNSIETSGGIYSDSSDPRSISTLGGIQAASINLYCSVLSVNAEGVINTSCTCSASIYTLGGIKATGALSSGSVSTGNITSTGVIKTSNTTATSICTSGGIKATGALSSGSVSTGNITSTGVIKTSNTTATSICTSGGIKATGALSSGSVSTGDITSTGNITAKTGTISGDKLVYYCGSNHYSYLGYEGLKTCCTASDSIRTDGGIYSGCTGTSISALGGIYSGCTGVSLCAKGKLKTSCNAYNSIETSGGIYSNCTGAGVCINGQLKTFCNAYNSIETCGGIYSYCAGTSICVGGVIKTYCTYEGSIYTAGGISAAKVSTQHVSSHNPDKTNTFCGPVNLNNNVTFCKVPVLEDATNTSTNTTELATVGYVNTCVSGISSNITSGDSTTLSSAKSYTNTCVSTNALSKTSTTAQTVKSKVSFTSTTGSVFTAIPTIASSSTLNTPTSTTQLATVGYVNCCVAANAGSSEDEIFLYCDSFKYVSCATSSTGNCYGATEVSVAGVSVDCVLRNVFCSPVECSRQYTYSCNNCIACRFIETTGGYSVPTVKRSWHIDEDGFGFLKNIETAGIPAVSMFNLGVVRGYCYLTSGGYPAIAFCGAYGCGCGVSLGSFCVTHSFLGEHLNPIFPNQLTTKYYVDNLVATGGSGGSGVSGGKDTITVDGVPYCTCITNTIQVIPNSSTFCYMLDNSQVDANTIYFILS